MDRLFLELFNMSISASWVILAVLLLRFVLKGAPKAIRVLLWGAVGFRLVCPFSLKTALSLIPSAQTLAPEALYDRTPELTTGIPAVNEVINPSFSESFTADITASVNPLQVALIVAANIWVLGMVAMALYGAVSYLLLRRKVAASLHLRDNIWLCDHVPTPFILGWIRPKIYLPSGMPEELYEPVIAHEHAHIKGGDHWIKLAGFVLLCVYWFHPLVWLAYILLCRDIELACDERVIKGMDASAKKGYSEALLACGIKTRRIAACPLAFGEVGVKQRIKSVLSYKKPTIWIILIAIAASAVLAVCFLTDPVREEQADKSDMSYLGVLKYRTDLSIPVGNKRTTATYASELREAVPQYFEFDEEQGLELYVWEEQGEIWCGLMQRTGRPKSQKEVDALVALPLTSMREILVGYCFSETDIHIIGELTSLKKIAGSNLTNDLVNFWLRNELWMCFCHIYGSDAVACGTAYNERTFYYSTGEIVDPEQLGLCLAEKQKITSCVIYDEGPLYSVYTIKDKGLTYLAVAEVSSHSLYVLFEQKQ